MNIYEHMLNKHMLKTAVSKVSAIKLYLACAEAVYFVREHAVKHNWSWVSCLHCFTIEHDSCFLKQTCRSTSMRFAEPSICHIKILLCIHELDAPMTEPFDWEGFIYRICLLPLCDRVVQIHENAQLTAPLNWPLMVLWIQQHIVFVLGYRRQKALGRQYCWSASPLLMAGMHTIYKTSFIPLSTMKAPHVVMHI